MSRLGGLAISAVCLAGGCLDELPARSGGEGAEGEGEGSREGEGEGEGEGSREGEGEGEGPAEGEGEGEGPVEPRPCVRVRPETLEFRVPEPGLEQTLSATLESCSEATIHLEAVELTWETSRDFSLTRGPELPQPLRGESIEVTVTYAPVDAGADEGILVLRTDVPGHEELTVKLFGKAGDPGSDLPVCRALARMESAPTWDTFPSRDEALVTVPLPWLLLWTEDLEDDEGGRDVSVRWTILDRPRLSHSRFEPNAHGFHARLQLDLAGHYAIGLEVTDLGGQMATCEVHVVARPQEDLYLELLWSHAAAGLVPPEVDVDVDLHLLQSPGPWFCAPGDCYSGNAAPDWGRPGVEEDDPRLYWDAHEGTAPEVIGLRSPESNRELQVGAHAMGGGAAGGGRIEAWLRVHVHGELAWESEDPAWFVDGDAFRTLVAIDWPSGDVREHDSYTTPAPRGPCE